MPSTHYRLCFDLLDACNGVHRVHMFTWQINLQAKRAMMANGSMASAMGLQLIQITPLNHGIVLFHESPCRVLRQGKLTYSEGPSFYDGGWQVWSYKITRSLRAIRFENRLDRSMAMESSGESQCFFNLFFLVRRMSTCQLDVK